VHASSVSGRTRLDHFHANTVAGLEIGANFVSRPAYASVRSQRVGAIVRAATQVHSALVVINASLVVTGQHVSFETGAFWLDSDCLAHVVAPSVASLARVGNIASPHVGVQHEPLPASALVISSDASRDTDLFASPVPDLAHVCRYASSVVRVELVSFPARAVVTSSGVHAVVSTSSVDIGAFVNVDASFLII